MLMQPQLVNLAHNNTVNRHAEILEEECLDIVFLEVVKCKAIGILALPLYNYLRFLCFRR